MGSKSKPVAKVVKSKMRRLSPGEDRLMSVLALYFPERQAREEAAQALCGLIDSGLRRPGSNERTWAEGLGLLAAYEEQRERMTGE